MEWSQFLLEYHQILQLDLLLIHELIDGFHFLLHRRLSVPSILQDLGLLFPMLLNLKLELLYSLIDFLSIVHDFTGGTLPRPSTHAL